MDQGQPGENGRFDCKIYRLNQNVNIMFRVDSEGKELRKAMQAAGADMSVVRSWLKTADKMKKIIPQAAGSYRAAYDALVQTGQLAGQLEKVFILIEPDLLERKDFEHLIFRMKELSGTFDHELVVSREDGDFHLTYDTIIRLAGEYSGENAQRLILQSEVENLQSLIREILERERLADYEVGYFYCTRTDAGLTDIPPQDRIDKLHRVFQNEFLENMQHQMAACMREAAYRRARGDYDRCMDILLTEETIEENWEEQAKRKLMDLVRSII